MLWSDDLDRFVARVPQRQKAAPQGRLATDEAASGAPSGAVLRLG